MPMKGCPASALLPMAGGNDLFGRGTGDTGDAQTIAGRGEVAEFAGVERITERVVHPCEVFLTPAGQPEGSVFIADLEPPAVPVVPNQTVRPDEFVGEIIDRLLRGVAI